MFRAWKADATIQTRLVRVMAKDQIDAESLGRDMAMEPGTRDYFYFERADLAGAAIGDDDG